MHDPFRIELPVFVSICTVPLPRIIMELVGKPNRDPIAIEGPEFLDEPVLQLSLPFAQKEAHNFFAPVDEL